MQQNQFVSFPGGTGGSQAANFDFGVRMGWVEVLGNLWCYRFCFDGLVKP
jgi:hypothetical protein